jgi:hypothetical protein
VRDGDLEIMGAPIDFLGINFYSRAILRSDKVPEADNAPRVIPEPDAASKTDIGWEVFPDGLEALLLRLHADYPGLPLAITENGASYFTAPDPDGAVRDTARLEYFRGHLAACVRAIDAGVPLFAYFAWSLMDNFEWAWGYEQRFGLVWVDFETQQRIPKDSAIFYAGVMRTREVPGVGSGRGRGPPVGEGASRAGTGAGVPVRAGVAHTEIRSVDADRGPHPLDLRHGRHAHRARPRLRVAPRRARRADGRRHPHRNRSPPAGTTGRRHRVHRAVGG